MDARERLDELMEEKIRPFIKTHGGDARLIGFENGVAQIELSGACSGCPAADLGTKGFIENILCSEIPEVESVELAHTVNPELLAFAKQILSGNKAS